MKTAFIRGNLTPEIYWNEYRAGAKYNLFNSMFEEYLE